MTIEIKPANGGYILRSETRLPVPRDEVFPFFADPRNLERITPNSLRFHIVTPDEELVMADGLLIDYKLKVRGLPMRWRSRITEYDPPHRFVDEQLNGPYRRWHHIHEFETDGNGTIVRDTVQYEVPGGPLSPIIHALFVKPDVLKIFSHRQHVLAAHFEINSALPDQP